MATLEDRRILEGLSENALILSCVRCSSTGKLGPLALSPACPICSGRGKVGVIVEGRRPLEVCLQCGGSGKLGSLGLSPACPSCKALGCLARSGVLNIVSLDGIYAAAQRPAGFNTVVAEAVRAALTATTVPAVLTPPTVSNEAIQVIFVRSGAVRDTHLEVAALFKRNERRPSHLRPFLWDGVVVPP